MKKFQRLSPVIFSGLFLAMTVALAAAQEVEEKDRDGDGRKETKVYYENGQIVKMVSDRNHDKKTDETVFFKNGVPDHGEKDADFNGKVDTWSGYDASGFPNLVARDKSGRGKPDTWIHAQNGSVVMREWDRNFDGKPDLRIIESRGHVLEKQYDDNFDGRFEKIVKAPRTVSDTLNKKKPRKK